MRLWTIQTPDRLHDLNRDGLIRGSWDFLRADEHLVFYIEPYKWMVEQMQKRLPDVSGEAPMWAQPHRPDLRRDRWQWGDRYMVLIEFDAPDDAVLLSDYGLWHQVLNNFHCSFSEAECDEFNDREDKRNRELVETHGFGYRKAWRWVKREFRQEIRASWERIFDPEAIAQADPEWIGSPPHEKQACLDHLRRDWIRSVLVFRSHETKGW